MLLLKALIFLFLVTAFPLATHAQDDQECGPFGCLEVLQNLPGGGGSDVEGRTMIATINTIAKFIMGITVLLGVIGVVIGGYLYMTASGNASQVEKGKQWIASALLGIILALASVVILNTINPELGEEAREPELHGSGGAGGGSGGETSNRFELGAPLEHLTDPPPDIDFGQQPGVPRNNNQIDERERQEAEDTLRSDREDGDLFGGDEAREEFRRDLPPIQDGDF